MKHTLKKSISMIFAAFLILCAPLSGISYAPVNASTAPGVSLETDWTVQNGELIVNLYIDNSVGATAWNFDLNFDPSVLEFRNWDDGISVAECAETKNNSISNMIYDTDAEVGLLKIGAVMQSVMFTQEEFTANAKRGKDALVNPEHCHICILHFTIADETAYYENGITLSVSGQIFYDGNPDYGYAAADAQAVSTSINKHSHKHNYTKSIVEATCTTDGYTMYTCDCGHSYTTDYVKASHEYIAATVVAPTFFSNGYTEYICKCGVMYRGDITRNVILLQNDLFIALGNTTVQTILQQAGDGAILKDQNDNTKNADAKIATGDKLILKNGDEIIACVFGDIDGDGNVTTADARLVLRNAVNLETFSLLQNIAAGVDGVLQIDVAHARQILRASVGLEDTYRWFFNLLK